MNKAQENHARSNYKEYIHFCIVDKLAIDGSKHKNNNKMKGEGK